MGEEWQQQLNKYYLSEDFGVPAFTQLGDMESSSSSSTPAGLIFQSNVINDNNINKSPAVVVVEESNHKTRPKNIFSRMLQISPNPKFPVPPQPQPLPPNNNNNNNTFKGCLAPLQISSPPNTPIKRRKSQTKKVVCIPAPAPANMMSSSRPSGEVVPSDLWAWRKYGQKPIKGSPYPRGYYRCSSSKGCLARKQVERSRTDPNMLVITYTSEHNHPWPTQRNALAGSTRSHHHPTTKSSRNPINISPPDQAQKSKEDIDQKELIKTMDEANSSAAKEEGILDQLQEFEELDPTTSYKPTLQPNLDHDSEDSFFADLGEIEGGGDPNLDLLFAQEFINSGGGGMHNKGGTCNLIHPFSFVYDWAVNNNNNNNNSSNTSYNGPGNKKANI
ncbi:hypothetical protein RD792_002291 [Penstemon davidsonii]|uniref:WRKY domain-containing protein n=1 Tax=Penstemon davidsonii TaxID=160366 RepID=A0ABR0DQL6_9LAMI|nr:hypothetical protein RD792_002291 [Penstemon davidsonii]